jgi:hypothetical protein
MQYGRIESKETLEYSSKELIKSNPGSCIFVKSNPSIDTLSSSLDLSKPFTYS